MALLCRRLHLAVLRPWSRPLTSNDNQHPLTEQLNESRTHEPELDNDIDSLFPSDIEERNTAYQRYKQDQARHSFRPNIDPKLTSIILFPGQGSQFVGMGNKLLHYPNVKEMYGKASALLGYNLLDVCLHGPQDKLDSTLYCQPALLVTSLAAAEKLKDDYPSVIENCVATAGFSVGEYAALVFAGALSFEQAVRLVAARARLMQEASDNVSGGMMSVFTQATSKLGLACQTAQQYCKVKLGMEQPVCRVANYLSPNCKVIAGNTQALKFISDHMSEFNLRRCKPLPVSGAFHTELMLPATYSLRAQLKQCTFHKPVIPVHCNISGKMYTHADTIPNILTKQLISPVKWEQTMHILYSRQQGQHFPRTFEVGPGKQLGTLLKVVNAKAYESYQNVQV